MAVARMSVNTQLETDGCDICEVQGTKQFLHGRKDAVNKHPAT